jgi:hypothetical protein
VLSPNLIDFSIVADPHPDPNFHVDANPDQDPDLGWHQNNADPHANPTPIYTYGKI